MKQGDRRLFVLNGSLLKAVYPNVSNFIVFYDVHILRVNKLSYSTFSTVKKY